MSKNILAANQTSSTKLIMDYAHDPYEQAILLTLLPRLYPEAVVKKMLTFPPQTDALTEWVKQSAQQAKAAYEKDLKKVVSKYKKNMEALLTEATAAAIKQ